MNILFVTTLFDHPMTGAGRFARCVADLGNDDPETRVLVLSEDVNNDPDAGWFRVKLSPQARWKAVDYWYKSRDYARALHQLLTEVAIDVLFFNDAWIAGCFLRGSVNLPTVVFVHDDNALQVVRNGVKAIPGMAVRRSLEAYAVRKATKVLTNSVYMHKALVRSYRMPENLTQVIRLAFTDYEALPFVFNYIDEDAEIRILFIKNDIRRGGLKLLLDALEKFPRCKFSVTVVGPDPTVVHQLAESRLKQPGHVRLNALGRMYDHDAVLRLMQDHHIFCVPAKREAFGVSNLEALASGLPVIYYEVGGIPEQLRQYAFKMQDRSVSALWECLESLMTLDIDNAEERARMAREWVCRYFKYSGMQESLRQMLKEACETLTKA